MAERLEQQMEAEELSTARLGWHGLTRGRYTRTGSGALMKELLGDFDSAMTMSLIRSRIRSGNCRSGARCRTTSAGWR